MYWRSGLNILGEQLTAFFVGMISPVVFEFIVCNDGF